MRRPVLLAVWIISDIILFVAAYALAYFLRVGFIVSTDFPLDLYLESAALVAPLWILVMAELGVFKLIRVQRDMRNLTYILFSCVMGSALFTLFYYFLFNAFFSRLLLVEAGVLSFVVTIVWHLIFDRVQRSILRISPAAFPVLIIGTNREAERFVKLLEEKKSPLKSVGILDPQGASVKDIAGIPVLGKLNVLEDVIRRLQPKFLVQCSNLEHTINMISVCRNHGIAYMLLPSVLGVVGQREEMVTIEGQSMAMVR